MNSVHVMYLKKMFLVRTLGPQSERKSGIECRIIDVFTSWPVLKQNSKALFFFFMQSFQLNCT